MAALAVAGGLALAGCGTSGGNEAAPDPTGSVATTASPDPTTTEPASTSTTVAVDDEHAEAGARYLDLVARPNCLVDAFAGKANDVPGDATEAEAMAALQPSAATIVEAYDEFIAGLEKGPWPADAGPLVDEVIVEVTAERELFEQLAEASDEDEFIEAFDALVESWTGEREEANALRAALGLDDAPVDVDCTRFV